ncbi:MAG: AAA family ATPase [Deltaproteobacteria bacterium]|nr:AAA family ATPase [Deltaproteobacteria bacterium]NTV58329.1 AAA family ATPase [Deltaproteobacteria bacterium]
MFLNHFKMNDHPFQERPPAEWILKDDRISQSLARLDYFSQQGTLALVVGQTGVGKSTLLRLFIQNLSRNRYRPLYLHFTGIPSSGLLRLIVTQLGEAPRRGKDNLFLQILDRTANADLITLLVIDEAHLIDPQALTDLRLLVSSALDTDAPVKIVLSGQESLAKLLARASLSDLVNRITVRCHLSALTKDQTGSYIDSRMRCAGSNEKVFEPEAKSLIHDYASGIPRQINNIATACLLNAAARNLNKINEPLVTDTMAEFRLP